MAYLVYTMLRMKEASEYTGLSAQTLRKLIDEGEIRANRIGSRGDRYVEKRELDRFMGRRPSEEPKGCAIYAGVSTPLTRSEIKKFLKY